MSEKKLLNEIMIEHSKQGGRLFRNNVGLAWSGKLLQKGNNGRIVLSNARPVRFGLCVGSGDLVGWVPVRITNEMVGSVISAFVSVECKTKRVATTEAQERFKEAVLSNNGCAMVIKTCDEYKKEKELWFKKIGALNE